MNKDLRKQRFSFLKERQNDGMMKPNIKSKSTTYKLSMDLRFT